MQALSASGRTAAIASTSLGASEYLRGTAVGHYAGPAPSRSTPRLCVEANKKVAKLQQVVLSKDLPGLGSRGDITKVRNGFWRNYLLPRGLAFPATEGIFANIEKEKQEEERRAREAKAKAQAMATALQTIGKFVIRKKTGDKDQIFGSVSPADIVEAIAQQTGRQLDKKSVELPEIKTTGTYDASIKLHPEVTGTFRVVVQREKQS